MTKNKTVDKKLAVLSKRINAIRRANNKCHRPRKQVTNLATYDFGHHDNICYRATVISIEGKLYFGFIKCWKQKNNYHYCRTRLFMPINSWHMFVRDVMPQMQFEQYYQRQFGFDETDESWYVLQK